MPIALLAERKLLGRFQYRYGPNRVGPFGILQPMADIGKLLFKQQFRPRTSIGWLFALAPAISMLTAVATVAIIPFSNTVDIFGTEVGLYGVDPSIGILFAFAFGAIAFYGLMLGGWASGSKYSFLGAMRSAAQLISYEVAQGLSLVGVVMMAGSLSLTEIVEAQADKTWFVVPQFVGFIIFLVAGFAETNRPPFDLPEADAELVGGYNTEYGGGRFAAYFAAEYLNIVVVSLLTVTLFFGGWLLPFGIDPPTWVDPIVVLVKMLFFVFLFIWVRATLPRLRYDQLMSLGWKVFLPLATLNALVTAILVVVLTDGRTLDPGDDVIAVQRAPSPSRAGGAYRAFGATLKGLRTTFGRFVEEPQTIQYPEEKTPGLPALPRPPQAAPLRGHGAGEVRRLLAVRGRLPGRLHPRRRRREHARRTASAPASATPRSTRSTCRAASSAATARSRARSTRSRWATTTRCPTTTAPTSSSPRRCCSPSRSSARRCGRWTSRFRAAWPRSSSSWPRSGDRRRRGDGVAAQPVLRGARARLPPAGAGGAVPAAAGGVRRRRAGRRLRGRGDGALRVRGRLRRRRSSRSAGRPSGGLRVVSCAVRRRAVRRAVHRGARLGLERGRSEGAAAGRHGRGRTGFGPPPRWAGCS